MKLCNEMRATLSGDGPSKGLISSWANDVEKLEQQLKHEKEMGRRCSETCYELEQENGRLQDALNYAIDYMDQDQQRRIRTELWPELFNTEENDD